MRRTFRAATVFTGAAAAVAGFAPMAGAATGAAGGLATVTPDATAYNCPSTSATSLVLWYSANEHHADPACIYGRGKVKIGDGGAHFEKYCAGYYSGYLWISGTKHAFTYGTHPLYNQKVSYVSLTKSADHSLCNTVH